MNEKKAKETRRYSEALTGKPARDTMYQIRKVAKSTTNIGRKRWYLDANGKLHPITHMQVAVLKPGCGRYAYQKLKGYTKHVQAA